MPAQNLPPPYRQTEPNSSPVVRLEQQVARVFDYTREKVFNRGLTLSEHHRGQVVRFEFVAPTDWVTPTLSNAFVGSVGSNQTFQLKKDGNGRVWTRGLVSRASAPAAGTKVVDFTLPALAPYAPAAREVLFAYSEPPTGTPAAFSVAPSGLAYESGSVTAMSLSGLSWEAKDASPLPWTLALQPAVVLSATFPGAPSGFLLLDVTEANGSPVGAAYPDIVAEKVGDRSPPLYRLRMRRCSGLTAGKTYALTLFVLAEPSAA